ncbi:hypothetical protein N665_2269s0002 [Sinapis alba]|nr:hypothetical protein N665_2269s0002 [Sinapis alba]
METMGNTTGPGQGMPEADFTAPEVMGGGSVEMPGMGQEVLDANVNWVYDMAWYGEAVRGDGFICEEHPAKLSSDGVWEKIIYHGNGLRIWQYRLPNLELVILFVFVLWQFFNILFRKMGLKIPKFTSMMLLSISIVVPYLFKMPLKESILLSLIMSHKGIVEISFYAFSFGLEFLDRATFSILVLSILLNSLFLPLAIRFLYDPSKQFMCYQKRSLVSTKINGAIKTLVCIHRPDHISSMINLLEASYQSEESPLTCYVLHLVELQGQDVPTLISHKVQKLGVGTGTEDSENVILSFEHFNRYVCSSISIDTFTCKANSNHMQDDICWLALDKAVTLIILPFHRAWSIDRTAIVSDSEMIRFVNYNVLKQAPCSVGILIERHLVNKKQETQQNLKVCAIFVGGKDDMEALAFAKRMARQENVTLTVLCLIAAGKSKGWDQMLDTGELRELILSNDTGNPNGESSTIYLEEKILDGAATSMLLRSMASDYDLFIVGKTCGENHAATRGIESWCEFEELGVIGDFLASPDFPSKTSVLVVQQQRTIAKYH